MPRFIIVTRHWIHWFTSCLFSVHFVRSFSLASSLIPHLNSSLLPHLNSSLSLWFPRWLNRLMTCSRPNQRQFRSPIRKSEPRHQLILLKPETQVWAGVHGQEMIRGKEKIQLSELRRPLILLKPATQVWIGIQFFAHFAAFMVMIWRTAAWTMSSLFLVGSGQKADIYYFKIFL